MNPITETLTRAKLQGHKQPFQNPRVIRLDGATVCQLKCPSCPTASGEIGEKLGSKFLKLKDFKRIVKRYPNIAHIELSNWGEVFLNPEILSIMKYAYRHNVVLNIANGANLNNVRPEVLRGIVKYKMHNLCCSIDGATQETYATYRRKGNLNQVLENIRTINRWKKHYRSPYPDLVWQYIVFDHNRHELKRAQEMARKLNMRLIPKTNWDDLYDLPVSPIKEGASLEDEIGIDVCSRQEYREKYGKVYVEKQCCSEMWYMNQINADGRVLGCPVNYWGDYGNAFKEDLLQILNGPKMTKARDMLMGKCAAVPGIPCTTCKIYKRIQETQDWITEEDIRHTHMNSRARIMLEHKILGRKWTDYFCECVYWLRFKLLKNN